MKRGKGIAILVFLLILVAASIILVSKSDSDKTEKDIGSGNGPETVTAPFREAASETETMMSDVYAEEESRIEMNLIDGDGGDESGGPSIGEVLEVAEERKTRSGFQNFMLAYANTQNYTPNGVNYGYADQIYKNGVDMEDSAARISGMGNAGYLMWVIRNTFGICGDEYLMPSAVYEKSEKVSQEELAIGDLGFLSEEGDVCGICIGLEDGEPVFSFMDGTWSKEFPFGSNRLCYLQDGKNEYIDQSPPVKFRYFCRPDLPWQIEDEALLNLKGRIPNGE